MHRGEFLEWLLNPGGMKRSLLLPFVAIIILSLGAAWFVDRQVSRAALGETADDLLIQTAWNLRTRVQSYLDGAILVAQSNAVIASYTRPDTEATRLMLWHQLLSRNDLDLSCVATADGEYVEASYAGAQLRSGRAGRATGGSLVLSLVDAQGAPTQETYRSPGVYDPRTRPWYLDAAAAGRPVWTKPYPLVSSGELAMAACVPFYREGALAGVCTADLRLGSLSRFLDEATSFPGARVYILDGEGKVLIASSPLGEAATMSGAPPEDLARLAAAKPGSINATGRSGLQSHSLALAMGGRATLAWNLVVVFPQEAFLDRADAVDRATLGLLGLALLVTLFFGFTAAHRVSMPLRRLGSLAEGFEPGRPFEPRDLAPLTRRADEIGKLALTFGDMAGRLQESFASLKASVTEKEILLKELNHRVKNNLQIVSSLINAQALSLGDGPTREALDALQDRIQAMAYVHEDLVHSGNLGAIDMEHYLGRICGSLSAGCLGRGDGRSGVCAVSVQVTARGVELSMDQAITCGLIVNELVSNALKHAFGGRSEGSVQVTLEDNGGSLLLRVSDDGRGMEAAREAGGPGREGLGSMLIGALAAQLGGALETRSGPGGTSHVLRIRGRPGPNS